jgi:hypothetical protein
LVVVHLFALRAVDALEEGGDDAFLNLKLGFEFGDPGGQFGDLLLWSFDGSNRAKGVPTLMPK